MAERSGRRFSREFKLAALARMEAGANVSALARELGVRRKYLYQWRERFRAGGPMALRTRGRPTRAEVLAMRSGEAAPLPASSGGMPSPVPPDELAQARRRVAELERKVGQQQVELDFFRAALRIAKTSALVGRPRVRSAIGPPARKRSRHW